LDEEDPAEVEASKFDLAYISLDGNIGCLVNGAGLAMATMDTIKLYGGEPANFLDVGGGATTEKVTEAFKIMLKNPNLKAILVNIFGGIMKCDTIANGVVAASKAVNLQVPLVVRMKGTNEVLGKQILKDSGLPIISADTMAEAAEKVVAATKTGVLKTAAAPVAAAIAASAPIAATATAIPAAAKVAAGVAAATGLAAAIPAVTAAVTPAKKSGLPWWLWAALAALAAFLLLRGCGDKKADVAAPAAVVAAPVAAAPAAAAPVAAAESAAASVAGNTAGSAASAPAANATQIVADKAVNTPTTAVIASEKVAATPVATPAVAASGKDVCKDKVVPVDVTFVTGKDAISDASLKALAAVAKQLATCPAIKTQVAGHTDNVGKAESNMALSQRRADAVANYLATQGVAKDRVSAKGYGETKPIGDNASAEGRAQNRRVEFAAQ
jgi:outer membrane protein OmpA-like peptidoglycan-associated protein